jgi:hypothetical protein
LHEPLHPIWDAELDAGGGAMLGATEELLFALAGTHQVVKRSDATARVLICSTTELPEVADPRRDASRS